MFVNGTEVKLQEKPDIGIQHLSKNCGVGMTVYPAGYKYELSKVYAINEGEELVKSRTVIQKSQNEGNECMESRIHHLQSPPTTQCGASKN